MAELRFASAERERVRVTRAQQRQIQKMYKDLSVSIGRRAENLSKNPSVSASIRRQYLNNMIKDLQVEIDKIENSLNTSIRRNMSMTATAVVADANTALNRFGLGIKGAYSFVPSDVVQTIAGGHLYGGDWSLSKAIWNTTNKVTKDINRIIAEGVAANKSAYDIAKDLESYVDPAARLDWEWSKLYPGTSKTVDYNAQRLARTMVSHAYQESFVRTTKDNPFFIGYEWLISNHGNVCPICNERASEGHGVYDSNGVEIPGVFPKDDLPLDHPNGMCTFAVYMDVSFEEANERLSSWSNGSIDHELDVFARSLGYTPEQVKGAL